MEEHLEIILIIGMWFVFVLLFTYTILYSLKVKFIGRNDTLRKFWYIIYLLGLSVTITISPLSLFVNWQKYLIVLVVFVFIDSFIFLNLHFSKLGGQELRERSSELIDETDNKLRSIVKKLENMEGVLNSYDYPRYNGNKELYILDMKEFFERYCKNEGLKVEFYP